MRKYLINLSHDNLCTSRAGRIYRGHFGSINYFVRRLLATYANWENECLRKCELYEVVYLSSRGWRFGIKGFQSLNVPVRFVV